ncbi:MAG: hypothetical protein ABIH03_01040 [Pseudomonadota bacterium]
MELRGENERLRGEVKRMQQENAENAAMHKQLGFAGFDEDVSFAEAVKLLLGEFREANRKLDEAAVRIEELMCEANTARAEGRRQGLEEAAKECEFLAGTMMNFDANASAKCCAASIRRLKNHIADAGKKVNRCGKKET